MADPAAPILDVSQTQLEIQAAAANGRDAIAIGVLGVDAALVAAVVALQPTLGHTYWQPLVAIGASGLFALAALLQVPHVVDPDDYRHLDRHGRHSVTIIIEVDA